MADPSRRWDEPAGLPAVAGASMGPMLCKPMLAVTLKVRRRLAAGQCDRGQHVIAARHAAGPAGDLALWAEHEHGRGAPDVEPPDQIQPVGYVDLQMGHAVGTGGHVGEQLAGRAARRAEGRGELQQRGPGPERPAKVGYRRPLACLLQPPVAPLPDEAAGCREHEDGGGHDGSCSHARVKHRPTHSHSQPSTWLTPTSSLDPFAVAQAWAEATTLPPVVSSKVWPSMSLTQDEPGYHADPLQNTQLPSGMTLPWPSTTTSWHLAPCHRPVTLVSIIVPDSTGRYRTVR